MKSLRPFLIVLAFVPFSLGLQGQVSISEFMAANSKTLADQDGDFSDWIELHNDSNASVNLQGWSLTDSATALTKWRFPSQVLAPNAYLVVFASGKNRASAGAQLHASFSLDASGDYLALVKPDGVSIATEFAPAFPPQREDVSYGSYQGALYYFTQPTPSAANTSGGFLGLVADTKFNQDRGFYNAPFELAITSATTNAVIRYTTNGIPPTATTGLVYTGPITISGTTVLRAGAFKDGYLPGKIDTETYLFLDDVLRQSPDGSPPPGWPSAWGNNRVDYGMDPAVVDSPRYSATIKNDLQTIPSFSLVMDLNDLFGSRGIYSNPSGDGITWERPGSIELLYPDGADGFQVNAGIRIRGGYSRNTGNPKHAFRFFFREQYGDSKLRYPLFGDDGADEFDNIDLRTFQNYSWSFEGDSRGIFMRDQFSRDAQLAMGYQGERGNFYHLYINGEYWGLYNTDERPEASYGATYFGGVPEDYDVIKVAPDSNYTIYATDGNLNAWTRLWTAARAGLATDAAYQKIQGNNPDGTPNPDYEVLLDVDNLIDYMLVILYGGNLDAPISNFLGNSSPNNFFAMRNRTARQGFQYFAHDSEHTLLDVNQDRTGPFSAGNSLDKSNPQYFWQQCAANPEFRLRVADHVQRHFFNDGVFTPQGASNLLMRRKIEIDRAVVGESARWGDAQRSNPRTRDVEWVAEVNRILTNYIPRRTGIVVGQLRGKNLYPALAAPAYSQHGGSVPKNFSLSLSAPAGVLYYTLDGSDPRLPGGAVSASALKADGPITLSESVTVKSRALDGSTWSALNEATFTIIQTFQDLLVTEIMYNPPSLGGVDGEDFEFIELKNVGPVELDLSGVRFTNGVTFTFPNGTKAAPNQFIILVSNPAAFATKYPGVHISGTYTGRLSNSGETLTIVHAAGAPLFSVTYSDTNPWPLLADGDGFSLVPVNPNLNSDPSNPLNWRASSRLGGSPGADDTAGNIQAVWINEILTHTDLPDIDAIELFNPGPAAADISNWFLTDSRVTPKKFRIPSGTILPPGGFKVFTQADFNVESGSNIPFRFDSHGEEAYLYSADAAGTLTGFSDGFSFGGAANDVSFGRYVTSTGEIHYPAQQTLTLGAANSGPRVGPIVINELGYAPAPGDEEFIELKNISPDPVKLYDPAYPTNQWKLDGAGFSFPPNSEIAGNSLALVVPNDPSVFRSRHGVPASVPVFGPFSGILQNNGELVRLLRPDAPDLSSNGVWSVPYVVVDELRYNDKAPWPASAAGVGPSLERINPHAYGNDPVNWRASFATPSPGFENDANRVPRVNAGLDRTYQADSFPFATSVAGTASDDAMPNPPANLTFTWSQTSGPGPVTILSPNALSSSVRFPGVGTYVLRLTADDGELRASDDVSVTIERTPSEVTFIPAESIWKYLDDGSNQGALWRGAEFNDSTWKSGQAELGYGDSSEGRPEKTVVSFGPDSGNKYVTTYFRRTFNVVNAASVKQLTVSLMRDDGGIVYINGIEVFRSNMPQGDISWTTYSSAVVGGADESTFYNNNVNPAVLHEGSNLVAVEIHQGNPSSSDLSFDLALAGLALPDNQGPQVNAGHDLTVSLPGPAALQGSALDDGLPMPPGQLSVTWSVLSGPGTVSFGNPSSAVTTATFTAPGDYTLRLSANDGATTGSDDVIVTVTGGGFETWRAQQFTQAELADPNVSGESADPDHDGHTNLQEFSAGTNPKDPSSVLKADSIEWTDASSLVKLRFQAMAGKSYTVQRRDSLSGPWTKLRDIPADPSNRVVEVNDLEASSLSSRFYRIVTPLQL